MDKLFSVPATGEYLGGISKWTVYSWLSKGILHRTKIGSRTMIAESELLRFIRDGQRKGQK